MLILVLDPSGLTLDWCLRCMAAGHTVKLYTKGSRSSHIGEGLVDKVTNWRPYVKIADLIFVSDNLELMDEMQELIGDQINLDTNAYLRKLLSRVDGKLRQKNMRKNYDAS